MSNIIDTNPSSTSLRKLFDIKAVSDKVLNLIPDMILIKGSYSHVLWANEAFLTYYGMSNAQLQGLIDSPISKPDDTLKYIQDDSYVFNTGKTLDIPEESVTRFDGEVRYLNTVKTAFRDESGVITMTIGVSRDITDHKFADQKEKEAH